ncbi:UNVERIFIED_CONTAM: DNA-binding protein BIN4 [Sesamum radiatum]|uniref:DNA-binding protein BIN4 n=1 Tax=Sesamum radiatum TaxID=300843 RepID=A0AAW2KF78_SESRA
MSDSREESPDWLRSFQPPTQSAIELSSGSGSPLDGSPAISDDEDGINLRKLPKENDKVKSPKKNDKVKPTPKRKRQNEDESEREGKRAKVKDTNTINGTQKLGKFHVDPHYNLRLGHVIGFILLSWNRPFHWSLSSDSESSPDTQPCDEASKGELSANEEDLATKNVREMDNILLDHDGEPPMESQSEISHEKAGKEDEKTSKKKDTNISINGGNHVKEDSSRKHPGLQGSSSRLPLLLSEKVQRSKALVECEGDSIDLSGDVGSVGRKLWPIRSKDRGDMNDYIQLKPQSNVYEAETMVEGTLDGFSFDSEDENDKSITQVDQHEAAEEQPDGKSKRKPDKTSVCHKYRVMRRTNIDTGKGNRMVEDEAVAAVFPLRLSSTSGSRNPPSILLILYYVNDCINFIIVMNWNAGTVMTLHHITTGREKQEIEI